MYIIQYRNVLSIRKGGVRMHSKLRSAEKMKGGNKVSVSERNYAFAGMSNQKRGAACWFAFG